MQLSLLALALLFTFVALMEATPTGWLKFKGAKLFGYKKKLASVKGTPCDTGDCANMAGSVQGDVSGSADGDTEGSCGTDDCSGAVSGGLKGKLKGKYGKWKKSLKW